jgi:hypothetical protein
MASGWARLKCAPLHRRCRRDDNSTCRFLYHRQTSHSSIRLIVVLATACAFSSYPSARGIQTTSSLVDHFLARKDPPPFQYRALRHLDARNEHFGVEGWMDAWTDVDQVGGFRYQIVAEGGSGYIRSHVLRAALDGERKMWTSGDPGKAALTRDNYEFTPAASTGDRPALAALDVTPRRKDVLLVNGSIFVKPDDADLVRVEGKLSKTPSFWTRRVEVVRRYERINGVRVPIAIESVAQVLIAGRSTFKMTYEYEAINGEHVGNPQPRSAHP